jgi:hypothetical protein
MRDKTQSEQKWSAFGRIATSLPLGGQLSLTAEPWFNPPGSMLLADRGYDADWIRELATKNGVWANIAPKSNCTNPICFSPYLCRDRSRMSDSSIRSSNVVELRRPTTNLPPTTPPSSSLHQSGCGCALMSPRPNTTLAELILGSFGTGYGSVDIVVADGGLRARL